MEFTHPLSIRVFHGFGDFENETWARQGENVQHEVNDVESIELEVVQLGLLNNLILIGRCVHGSLNDHNNYYVHD